MIKSGMQWHGDNEKTQDHMLYKAFLAYMALASWLCSHTFQGNREV